MRTLMTALVGGIVLAQPALAQRGRANQPSDMSKRVRELAQAELEKLKQTGDYGAAQLALADLLDQTIYYSNDKELDAIVEADAPLRMVSQLAQLDHQTQASLLPVLLDEEELAWTLAMLVDKRDDVVGVYKTLSGLIESHGAKKVASFGNLAAAICVVQDRPFTRRVNENTAKSMEPAKILAYYADHVRELDLDPRVVPADLLVYVADTTETDEQMTWALNQYRRNSDIGQRFFEIKYDYDSFEKGTPKKLTASGEFSLEAIKKYGGVCADQAYFAMEVGKAKGLPTAYVRAQGAEVGHAWVGFLQVRGKRAEWNFDEGRYDAYQNIRGLITDPQTGLEISDARLGITAEDSTMDPRERRIAQSVCAAAERLGIERLARGFTPPSHAPDGVDRPAKFTPRTNSVEDQLALLESGLRMAPAEVSGWEVLSQIALRHELTMEQMDDWTRVIDRLCGTKYPDFMVWLLEPMIASVEDTGEQTKLWGWLYGQLRSRPDLASRVLMNQGDLMRRTGDPAAAWTAYMEVVNRYSNAGTAVVDALTSAEEMVRQEKSGDSKVVERDLIPMYQRAWQGITHPRQMAGAFRAQSNWYRVGDRLRELNEEAGKQAQADAISKSLNGSGGGGAFDD
ncbi:MAG: hypothetical protein R3B57_14080 [Phycisphaerales bacterium]